MELNSKSSLVNTKPKMTEKFKMMVKEATILKSIKVKTNLTSW